MTRRETESRRSAPVETIIDQKRFSELTVLELHDILQLRSQIFVVEQKCVYHDVDGRDTEPGTKHWRLQVDGAVAAYLRQLDDGSDTSGHHRIARIGRVATHRAYRKRGLAGQLVRNVIDTHEGIIVLDAQSHLEGWYESFGFVRSGHDFIEDGIPHVPMSFQPRSHQPNCP